VQDKSAHDILVNNAGITRHDLQKMDKVNWDAVMRTNLDSLFNMSKQVVDGMSSATGARGQRLVGERLRGAFGQTNYSAAKAGVQLPRRSRRGRKRRHRQHDLAGLHRD
jgi:acetoacetyl-CoA reductase